MNLRGRRSPATGRRTICSAPEDARTSHSAQKPVRLVEMPLLFHTEPGDLLYDPFAGSGTAIIAAQKTQRKARTMELDPQFVQAAIDRWEAYAGGIAVRHEARPR